MQDGGKHGSIHKICEKERDKDMTWWVILIEMFVFAGLFTAILFIYFRGDRKYSAASIPRIFRRNTSRRTSVSMSLTARKTSR